ncbi:6-phosphogluconate dehydrogenase, decarboxylating 2, chloroplastic [Nymphon striatum]|nr:6-phosphogluconate dehydrogenase, decarboxylating 2, chloroplastic [Nymphon striatum]
MEYPVPGLSNSLTYFDAYTSSRLPLNLIQAQRDYFGSHTYERVDRDGIFHTEWETQTSVLDIKAENINLEELTLSKVFDDTPEKIKARFGNDNDLKDYLLIKSDAIEQLSIKTYPTNVLVDPNGNIVENDISLNDVVNTIAGQDDVQQKINYYISQAKLDSAKTYIQTSLDAVDNKQEKNALNYQLVKVLFMQSDYNAALKQAFNSLDSIKDEKQRVNFNFMIGAIYSAITDYKKSVEYFDLVIAYNEDPSLTLQTHLLLSQLHIELNDSTKAGKSITEAYKITSLTKEESPTKNHVEMQYNFFNENYELYPEQVKVAANKLIEVYEKLGDQEKANAYHKIYNEAINDSLSFSAEKYRELYDVEKNRELDIAKTKNSRKYLIFAIKLKRLRKNAVLGPKKALNEHSLPNTKKLPSNSYLG